MGAETSGTQASKANPGNVFSDIAEAFKRNVESVHRLAEFDRVVLEYAIRTLEAVEQRAKDASISNYRLTVTQTLKQLRDIRKNDSLRPQYQHIFNQCVVLLVSYFGSAVSDIFERGIGELVRGARSDVLMDEELKVTVSELSEIGQELHEHLGGLLIRKKDISFQDMQSIARAFESYFGHSPEKDEDTNNIIAGQACRHAIVHSGAVVTDQCVRQVSKAIPRTLKRTLVTGENIQFAVDEIEILSESMIEYVDRLVAALAKGVQIGEATAGA